jgi:hypothetical protein
LLVEAPFGNEFFVYLNAGQLKNILFAPWVLVEKKKRKKIYSAVLAFEKRAVTKRVDINPKDDIILVKS